MDFDLVSSMNDCVSAMQEETLSGGSVNHVTRIGDVVLKTAGPWTEAVQIVLRHLESRGFIYAPRALGRAEDGREMLSFLPGDSMLRPWRAPLLEKDGLVQATNMVRRLHAATRDLVFPADTEWQSIRAGKVAGQILRHGDLGPWNTLWQEHTLTGLVDWDLAEPGNPLTDLAQLAYYFVPLRGESGWRDAGFDHEPDFERRIEAICTAYGSYGPAELIIELDCWQRFELERTQKLGGEGRYPWCQWLAEGEIEVWESDNRWLRQRFKAFFSPE